jgi:hypothetical protein
MEPPRCPGRRKNPYSGWHTPPCLDPKGAPVSAPPCSVFHGVKFPEKQSKLKKFKNRREMKMKMKMKRWGVAHIKIEVVHTP